MKTFGEFFGPYIELSRYPESMHHGELTGLQIDTRNRVLTAKVAFPALVDRNTLFHAERRLPAAKRCNCIGQCSTRSSRRSALPWNIIPTWCRS